MTVQFIFECISWDNKVFDIINGRCNHEVNDIRFLIKEIL